MLPGLVSILFALTATPASAPYAAEAARGLSETISELPDTTGWVSPPRRPLPFSYDLYTFRGTDRRTAVVASFAVPIGELERAKEDSDFHYRFDVTLVLADTALRTVYRTDDSVYVRVPRPLAGAHLLHTHIELEAPPSTTTIQRVIMTDASTPGIGQLYSTPFPVPDYNGTDLMLSDIALGVPDSRGGLRRGDVAVALLPTGEFSEGSFDLYYEVYNLPVGNRYLTEIAIEEVEEDGTPKRDAGSPVGTRFTGESATRPDGSLGELRRVDTDLERGRYRLTVTVTDQDSGHAAQRSRFFDVRGRGRGATLVPALPRRGGTTE
ncbi:MAG TPA: hypothetical protein VLA36_15280 [Longimicrobiales bacterium]|nr:hypothetical protein [Longimicrobiales bacterium]